MQYTFEQLLDEIRKLSYEDLLQVRDLVDALIEKKEAEEAMTKGNVTE